MAITGRGRFNLVASLALLATVVFLATKNTSFHKISVKELLIFPEVLEEDIGFHNEQADIPYDPHDTIRLSTENKTNQDSPPTKNVQKKAGNCREVQFSKTKLPLTYLTSSPGSGNTWVRYLLQQATGKYIYSQSVLELLNYYVYNLLFTILMILILLKNIFQ